VASAYSTQEQLGEQAQAELLAELHQQQVHRHVRHHVGGRQPLDLGREHAQRALRIDQIDGDQRIAQAAGERDDETHQQVCKAARR
jgi:hypothetical protein